MVPKPPKKAKKPLETTLGKASAIPKEAKNVDLSHVRKPIDTSLFGLRQVLSLFKTGTEEVQNYITFECDLMYECRICRTIFRSLANFILHKRNYCREQYNPLGFNKDNDEQESCSVIHSISKENSNDTATTKKAESSCITNIVDRLKDRQKIVELNQKTINEDFSKEKVENDHKETVKPSTTGVKNIVLEEIPATSAAVFQTVFSDGPPEFSEKAEFMKTEVMEIHSILDENEAVLDSTGRVCEFKTNKLSKIPKGSLFCTECNIKFSTKKTLSHHLKYKHNRTQLVYICPDCKDPFANAWCVYRHLMKVHRKTSQQIRRLRQQIHNSVVRKDNCPKKKKDNAVCSSVEEPDEENQWLTNVEDNYFQMCGGCGKRFERKAALHSHVTMCLKRMAVCNSIKENNAKKRGEDTKGSRATDKDKSTSPSGAKGASKRKPYLLRTYKRTQLIRTDCDENANSGMTGVGCCEGENTAQQSCSTTATSEKGGKGVLITSSTSHYSVPPTSANISEGNTSEGKHISSSNEVPAPVKFRKGSGTIGVDDAKLYFDTVSFFSGTTKDQEAMHKGNRKDIQKTTEDITITCTIKENVQSTSTIDDFDGISKLGKVLHSNDTDFHEDSKNVILVKNESHVSESVNKESLSRQSASENTIDDKVIPAENIQDAITDTTQGKCILPTKSTILQSILNDTHYVSENKDIIWLTSASITSNEEKYAVPFESMASEIQSCLEDGIHDADDVLENKVPSVDNKSKDTETYFIDNSKNIKNECIDYGVDMPEVKNIILSETNEGENSFSVSTTAGYMLNDSKDVKDGIVAITGPSLINPTIDSSIDVLKCKDSLLTPESNSCENKVTEIKVESSLPFLSTTSNKQEFNTTTENKDANNSSANTDYTSKIKELVPLSIQGRNHVTNSDYNIIMSLVNQSNDTNDTNDSNTVNRWIKTGDLIISEDIAQAPLNKANDGSDSVAKESVKIHSLMMEDHLNTSRMLNPSPELISKIKLRIFEMLKDKDEDNSTDEDIVPKKSMNVVMKRKDGSTVITSISDLERNNMPSLISISSDDGDIIGNQDEDGTEMPSVVRKLHRDKLGRFSSNSGMSKCVLRKHRSTRNNTISDDNKNIDNCSKSVMQAEHGKTDNEKNRDGSHKKSDTVDRNSPERNSTAHNENSRSSIVFNQCVVNLKKMADETSKRSRTPEVAKSSDERDSSPELRGFPQDESESLKAVKSLIAAVTRDWAEGEPSVEEIKSTINWKHVSADMNIDVMEPSKTKIRDTLKKTPSRGRNQNQKYNSSKKSQKFHKNAKSCATKNNVLCKTKNFPRKNREPKVSKNKSPHTSKNSLSFADEKKYIINDIGMRISDYIIVKDESTGNRFVTNHPRCEEEDLQYQAFEEKEIKTAVQKRGLKRKHAGKTIQCHREKNSLRQELEKTFGGIVRKALPYMDIQLLQCKPCHKTFSKLTKLINHMSAHFSWFRYQCSSCTLVSYSKADCISHVIEQHRVSQEYLSSMVLPIPSWKTLLMSHDFKELEEHEDTTGKHIDEIIVGYNEEPICIDDDDEVLYSSSNETEELPLVPHPGIDMVFSDDTQQVEVPTEIYSCEPYELLDSVEGHFDDRAAEASDELLVVEDFNEFLDDTSNFFGDLFGAPVVNPEPYLTEDTTHPGTSEIRDEPSVSTKHLKNEYVFPTDRPMRNRIRSEKSDFVYDMKAVKLNKVRPKSKNGLIATTTMTSTKTANSYKGLKSIKVYTKKQK